jgi:5-methylcytosine-specific restriction endonuclease McrA
MMDQYKLEKGCAKCGYNEHPAALEFDHIVPVRTKTKKRYGSRNKKEFFNIINDSNIQVLCANCHRIKTRENGDYLVGEAI